DGTAGTVSGGGGGASVCGGSLVGSGLVVRPRAAFSWDTGVSPPPPRAPKAQARTKPSTTITATMRPAVILPMVRRGGRLLDPPRATDEVYERVDPCVSEVARDAVPAGPVDLPIPTVRVVSDPAAALRAPAALDDAGV